MAYNKINWTSGEKVREGYVIIDGVTYQTVQPTYSGNTPVNVENLNHMDEGIYEANNKSSIMCNGKTDTNSTSTSTYTQIPLSQNLITGDKLRFDTTNNRIYADEACNVIVSAQIYITAGISASSTSISILIRKNGEDYKRALCPIPNKYRMAQISGVLMSLSADDYIDLAFLSGDKTGITASGTGDTFITLQEI